MEHIFRDAEPEPACFGRSRSQKNLAGSGSGQGVDILTIFFGNFNFKFSKNFKISNFFPKLIDFKLTFKKIQKLEEITSQITFLTLCIVRKSFPFRSRNGAGAETSEPEPEPPNFGPAPHPCLDNAFLLTLKESPGTFQKPCVFHGRNPLLEEFGETKCGSILQ